MESTEQAISSAGLLLVLLPLLKKTCTKNCINKLAMLFNYETYSSTVIRSQLSNYNDLKSKMRLTYIPAHKQLFDLYFQVGFFFWGGSIE